MVTKNANHKKPIKATAVQKVFTKADFEVALRKVIRRIAEKKTEKQKEGR